MSLHDLQYNSGPVAAPEALAAEQNLLGSALLFPNALSSLCDLMVPGDFVEPLHGRIFETMVARHQIGETVTAAGIIARLGNQDLNGTSLKDYLAYLTAQCSSPSTSIPAIGRSVRDAAGMRALESIADDLNSHMASGGILDPLPIAIKLIEQADAIVSAGMGDLARPVSMGRAARTALDAALEARENKTAPGIKTHIPELDGMLNGLRAGNLYIVGGRPGMGKSALAITLGLNAALDGIPVMMASLEMTAPDLAERALSAMARRDGHSVPYENISKGIDLTDSDVVALERAEATLNRLTFDIDPRPGLSFGQIASSARRFFAKHKQEGIPGLLLVDYLGLIKSGDRYRSNRVQELGETTRAARQIGKELGVAVVLLAQLNRGVESRDEKRPTLQDLRDSGEIEQDADVVIMTYREEYYLQQVNANGLDGDELTEHMERVHASQNVLELGILKQRKGRTGWVRNYCDIGCNTVTGLARDLRAP
jgi:replicative DNA helicase